MALFCITGIFILRPGNPALRFRQAIHHCAHGANEGFNVLDRHDPSQHAQHQGWIFCTLCPHFFHTRQVDAIRNILCALTICTIAHLTQTI